MCCSSVNSMRWSATWRPTPHRSNGWPSGGGPACLPVLAQIETSVTEDLARYLPNTAMAEALAYPRSQLPKLIRYADYSDARIDNNLTESRPSSPPSSGRRTGCSSSIPRPGAAPRSSIRSSSAAAAITSNPSLTSPTSGGNYPP